MGNVNETIYQLKVTLCDIEPPIWRRLRIAGDTSLAQLHRILQITMGWEAYHLYQFEVGGFQYGVPESDVFASGLKDATRATLAEVASEGDVFHYEYDFGDAWEHEILVEARPSRDDGSHYPRCEGGERACPPEDCGGSWGYENLLAALADPKHDDHEDLTEWIGGSFDAGAFTVAVVNRSLQTLGLAP
jgi:hypothetical protein